MRVSHGILALTITLTMAPVEFAAAHGGGSMGGGATGSTGSVSYSRSTPEDQAKDAYNSGVRSIKKARDYDSDAAKAPSPEKATKAQDKAHQAYSKALEQFIDAVAKQPSMYQAWNYIGFANRHLGNYDDSLSAYAKALELNPDYPDAIEYRGEAYLGLNRIDDAKQAYMSLFRDSRGLADELMTAMHHWIDARRKDAQGVGQENLEAFSQWVEERSGIAAQTASLAIGARTVWQ
jgi:tetratricopeptide (TPR) repeat protein